MIKGQNKVGNGYNPDFGATIVKLCFLNIYETSEGAAREWTTGIFGFQFCFGQRI